MKFKKLFLFIPVVLLISSNLVGCGVTYGEKEYYIKNQYFSNAALDWDSQKDPSIKFIEDKFGIKIAKTAAYTWNDWQTQVITDINDVKSCPDIFHYSMDNKNFNAIQEWAELGLIRDVPDELINKHPRLAKQVNSYSSKDYLKINGKLYGLPLLRDMTSPNKNFTNATYIYRRDLLEEDPEGKELLHEDDTYTLGEFENILRYFKNKYTEPTQHPFLEIGWGVLSLIDLYRDSLTCFTRNSEGEIINNFTSPGFIEGLKHCKELMEEGLMARDNITQKNDNWAVDQYGSERCFVIFQNFDFSNYTKMLNNLTTYFTKAGIKFNDDKLLKALRFLKITNDKGLISVEGNENWYSITLFKDGMSDTKLDKYLEILDYLIGDVEHDEYIDLFRDENEGRRLCIFGVRGTDYDIEWVGGTPKVNLDIPGSRWKKKDDGTYAAMDNGAKYLRYTISVNEEVSHHEPWANQLLYEQLKDWKKSIIAGKEGEHPTVRVVIEPDDIRWADCPKKTEFNAILLSHATNMMKRYVVTPSMSIDDYVREVNSNSHWGEVLKELNDKLRK